MARGYKRLSFRARHLLRQLSKAKNITLQRLNLHELRHAISRKHGFKGPKKAPGLGTPGLYQRLSGKARHLMRRLRHSRTWQVQKQSVTELEREVERGARVAQAKENRREAREERIDRMIERAKRAAGRGRKAGAAASRGVRAAGRKFRTWAREKQRPGMEKVITRAGRKSRQRYAGPFSSARAHRRWGRQSARREVPGLFARFAGRRGWTRLQPGHSFTPAARAAEARSQRRMTARASRPQAPRPARPPRTPRPRPARTR